MTAGKLLRHLRYNWRLRPPPVLSHFTPFLSNSSTIPSGNFVANPRHSSIGPSVFSNYMACRPFSWRPWSNSKEFEKVKEDLGEGRLEIDPIEDLEMVQKPLSISSIAIAEVTSDVFDENTWFYYPIQSAISMFDCFHDFTGLPWWAVISISTVALRASLLPVLILQLKKMAKLGELLPKLLTPDQPLQSKRSFHEQYRLFNKKRRELGCPSYLWNFAFFAAQFPCFLLWMSSIRRMCLDHHPGFDSGGTLWFQNLTDFPNGVLSFTFPTLIAVLHYINVQVSFRTIKTANLNGVLGLLAKFYKLYLDILSLPLFIVGFYIPQGSLVYWATNSSLTLVQQLCLKNPTVRSHLGLPVLMDPVKNRVLADKPNATVPTEILIPIKDVPPEMLLEVALKDMASGDQERALILLRKAIEKDHELAQAFIAIGQILCSKKSFAEAAQNFELAIPKIKEEEIGLLVISLFGAGVSRIWQGKNSEGIEHLKKIAELSEPDNPMDKASYYRGLVMLGSTLFQLGEKSDALKYLRIAATYDPSVDAYIKECEEG